MPWQQLGTFLIYKTPGDIIMIGMTVTIRNTEKPCKVGHHAIHVEINLEASRGRGKSSESCTWHIVPIYPNYSLCARSSWLQPCNELLPEEEMAPERDNMTQTSVSSAIRRDSGLETASAGTTLTSMAKLNEGGWRHRREVHLVWLNWCLKRTAPYLQYSAHSYDVTQTILYPEDDLKVSGYVVRENV